MSDVKLTSAAFNYLTQRRDWVVLEPQIQLVKNLVARVGLTPASVEHKIKLDTLIFDICQRILSSQNFPLAKEGQKDKIKALASQELPAIHQEEHTPTDPPVAFDCPQEKQLSQKLKRIKLTFFEDWKMIAKIGAAIAAVLGVFIASSSYYQSSVSQNFENPTEMQEMYFSHEEPVVEEICLIDESFPIHEKPFAHQIDINLVPSQIVKGLQPSKKQPLGETEEKIYFSQKSVVSNGFLKAKETQIYEEKIPLHTSTPKTSMPFKEKITIA